MRRQKKKKKSATLLVQEINKTFQNQQLQQETLKKAYQINK